MISSSSVGLLRRLLPSRALRLIRIPLAPRTPSPSTPTMRIVLAPFAAVVASPLPSTILFDPVASHPTRVDALSSQRPSPYQACFLPTLTARVTLLLHLKVKELAHCEPSHPPTTSTTPRPSQINGFPLLKGIFCGAPGKRARGGESEIAREGKRVATRAIEGLDRLTV